MDLDQTCYTQSEMQSNLEEIIRLFRQLVTEKIKQVNTPHQKQYLVYSIYSQLMKKLLNQQQKIIQMINGQQSSIALDPLNQRFPAERNEKQGEDDPPNIFIISDQQKKKTLFDKPNVQSVNSSDMEFNASYESQAILEPLEQKASMLQIGSFNQMKAYKQANFLQSQVKKDQKNLKNPFARIIGIRAKKFDDSTI